jgi:hypothetical protein
MVPGTRFRWPFCDSIPKSGIQPVKLRPAVTRHDVHHLTGNPLGPIATNSVRQHSVEENNQVDLVAEPPQFGRKLNGQDAAEG